MAFTASELQMLEENREFSDALAAADDTDSSTTELVKLGGAILSRRHHKPTILNDWRTQ